MFIYTFTIIKLMADNSTNQNERAPGFELLSPSEQARFTAAEQSGKNAVIIEQDIAQRGILVVGRGGKRQSKFKEDFPKGTKFFSIGKTANRLQTD